MLSSALVNIEIYTPKIRLLPDYEYVRCRQKLHHTYSTIVNSELLLNRRLQNQFSFIQEDLKKLSIWLPYTTVRWFQTLHAALTQYGIVKSDIDVRACEQELTMIGTTL